MPTITLLGWFHTICGILSILIVVGCLYFFEIWPFAPEDKDTGLVPQDGPLPTPTPPPSLATSPEAQPLPNLKEPGLFPPQDKPTSSADYKTPTQSLPASQSPQFQTPPTIPPDPAFGQDMPKFTGGGIRIFKKR